MNDKEKMRVGRVFVQHLSSESKDVELFKTTLEKFATNPLEDRQAVGMGLLAIGADKSKNSFYRNTILTQLALFVRTCGLQNNLDAQRQLNDIIDEWLLTSPEQVPSGALLALARVNLSVGLEKCDFVIKHYGQSEAGNKMREFHKNIERLKPLRA